MYIVSIGEMTFFFSITTGVRKASTPFCGGEWTPKIEEQKKKKTSQYQNLCDMKNKFKGDEKKFFFLLIYYLQFLKWPVQWNPKSVVN